MSKKDDVGSGDRLSIRICDFWNRSASCSQCQGGLRGQARRTGGFLSHSGFCG